MKSNSNNSIRKAAVLVRGLAPEAAETVYARLSSDEASRLRLAVARLGEIDEVEQQSVAEELRISQQQAAPRVATPIIDDREGVALEIDAAAYDAESPRPYHQEPSHDAPHDWFASLEHAEPASIAGYLAAEQPRAIALVLSYVRPEMAASVLSEFPEEQQSKILLQLANLGEADPMSVRVLATGLAAWIQRQQNEEQRRADRLGSVKAIVAALPNGERRGVVERLQQSEPLLADDLQGESAPSIEPTAPTWPSSVVEEKISPPRPTVPPRRFKRLDDLMQLDHATLSRLLKSLGPRVVVLALAEASEPLLAKIESRLSRRAVHDLRQNLLRLGPTTLVEIDRAQETLLLAAERAVMPHRPKYKSAA